MAVLTDYTDLLKTGKPSSQGTVAAPVVTGSAPAPTMSTGEPLAAVPGMKTTAPALVHFNPGMPQSYSPGTIPADWQGIIASNPDYMAWSLGAGQKADTAASNRRAAMRALAIRFGGLPANFQDVYGDIDAETSQLASANPESESNRLLRQYNDQVEAQRRQLAARGMLQSGELGYGQGQLDLARQGDVYNQTNAFLDAAQGTINDYANVIGGLNEEQINQIRSAADKIAQDKLYQAQLSAWQNYQPIGGGETSWTDGTDSSSQPPQPPAPPAYSGPAELDPGIKGLGGYGRAIDDPIYNAYYRAKYRGADLNRMYQNWYKNQAAFGL